MKSFYHVLANNLIATISTNFVWFALTFWAYLQTRSVLATSLVGGAYLVANTLCAIWFGSIVDHNRKKRAMLGSSMATLAIFSAGLALYLVTPKAAFTTLESPRLWAFAMLLLSGVIAGNIRNIAMPTLVTILVSEDSRDRANGLLGTVVGISFSACSFASGIILAYGGMAWVLGFGIFVTLVAIFHLAYLGVPEREIVHTADRPRKVDVRGTIAAVTAIPGLFALLFFNTFNNFLGGVYMSLMDPYGLSLVSVQVWGVLWGFVSLGFIAGGLYIAKRGLGAHPLRTLFLTNLVLWTISIFFTVQPSIVLLAAGLLLYITLIPFVEASEQTILQKVVPLERQGRVFGFAQTIEGSAAPITAFLVGPIAQFLFIPFMTTGHGVDLIGGWFGVGTGRGIALLFSLTGIIGLAVTLLAMRSRSYRVLSRAYGKA